MSEQNDEFFSQVHSLRSELDVAKDQIRDSAELEAGLRDQIKIMNAEVATISLQNNKLRGELENSGGDSHNLDKYKDMEQELSNAAKNIVSVSRNSFALRCKGFTNYRGNSWTRRRKSAAA